MVEPEPEEVDPRIQRRRREVAAASRRRRLRRGAVLLGLVTVAVGAWAITRTSLMEVSAVELSGAHQTAAEDIAAAGGIREGVQLTDVDPGAAEVAIADLPWVADATVSRDWLDRTVTITVTERTPAAALARPDAEPMLVDAEGRLLAAAPADPELPRISGVEVGEPGGWLEGPARDLLAVATSLSDGLATRVADIRPAGSGGAEMVLEPEGVAVIGEARDLDTKVRTLQTMLAAADMSCVETIDVQVPDTAVLTRGERCE